VKNMPLYEYVCRKCNHPFAEVLSVKEHETKKMHCPKCKSADLEKVIEPFFAKTARKTAVR
jgi:putative FmdB family regulatory protein